MDKTIRTSQQLFSPKKRVLSQLENYMARADPKYGDSFKKVKGQFPGLLKKLGLPSEEADVRAAVILSRSDTDITERNLNLAKKLDRQIAQMEETLHPRIAVKLFESGKNPLEMPLDELTALIGGLNEKYNQTGARGALTDIADVGPEMRPAVISLYKAFRIISRNDSAALGYAIKSGISATLGDLLNIASNFNEDISYTIYDETPIKEQITSESGIREEIKRACAYGRLLLTK